MKFLNTKYPSLFDSVRGNFVQDDSTDSIYLANGNTSVNGGTKYINNATSLYVRCRYSSNYNGSITHGFICITTTNLTFYLCESSGQLSFWGSNTTYWEGNVPSKSGIPTSNMHARDVYIHIDTSQDIVELYCDGILYASVVINFNGGTISAIEMGKLNTGTSAMEAAYLTQVIISDTYFMPTEKVTEVTPVLSSNDWTIYLDGSASTDNVGDVMTMTVSSDAIDETKRTVTGYGVLFTNTAISPTVNAVNITQDATTKQVVLPDNSMVETADTFSVAQLSSISATVTSAYVSS